MKIIAITVIFLVLVGTSFLSVVKNDSESTLPVLSSAHLHDNPNSDTNIPKANGMTPSPARIIGIRVNGQAAVVGNPLGQTSNASPMPIEIGSSSQLGPKAVQTQDFNYHIATEEITTADAYLYVTPAGNYSF
jgi:hypothetical protein